MQLHTYTQDLHIRVYVQEDTKKKECHAVFHGGNSAVGQSDVLSHSKHLRDSQTMFLHWACGFLVWLDAVDLLEPGTSPVMPVQCDCQVTVMR